MTKIALTPSEILRLLDKEYAWSTSDDFQVKLTYVEFKKNLMYTNEATTSERMVKEKWRDLIEFGIFKKSNKVTVVINISDIKEKLGVETSLEKNQTYTRRIPEESVHEECN